MHEAISVESLGVPVGPFSQAVRAAEFLFVSGQIGRNAAGELVDESVERQTEQTIGNLEEVLRAAGASLAHVVKVSVFLADIDDFAKMNEVYRRLFPQPPPARTTIAVSLVRGARVEMDAIAWIGTR